MGADHERGRESERIRAEAMSDTELEEQDAGFEGAPDEVQTDEPDITEADTLEQEESDDQETEPDAGADTEPEARVLSEAEIEKRYKKLDSEAKRHTSAVSKILEEDALELVECPLCEPELLGFLRMESLDHPRDEIHAAMINVLKKPAQVEYKPAPHSHTCESCDGLGQVLSGSRVAGKERIACPTCNGNGHVQQGTGAANGRTITPTSEYVPSGLPFEPLEEERDSFGSPRYLIDGRENPNYQKMIQYKDPSIEDDYLAVMRGELRV